jgi:hypothetical protein
MQRVKTTCCWTVALLAILSRTAAAQGSAAEAELPADPHCIYSLYGDAKLQFAAYLHAQLSTRTRGVGGVETGSSGSYQEFSFYMKACASEKAYAMAKMDVEDEDDVLEQLYFAWEDVGGSPVSFSFGEKQVRFGQWGALCYNSGLAYGWPMVAKDPRDTSGAANLRFPGWITDVVQYETKVRLHKTTDLYVSGLLNPRAAYGSTLDGRPRDTGFFQSYSVQLETKPFDGLHAKLSLLNFHDEEPRNRYDDSLLPAADASTDARAWSVGVSWSAKPWRVFAEYVGTDDWENVSGYDLHLYEAGVWFDATERFGFGFMYDWASARNQGEAGADADITSFIASIGCTFEKDAKAYLEYVHQEEKSAGETVNCVQVGVHWWF